MARQVIVVGDTLAAYGGTVTTGSNADIVDGKPVARKGDTVGADADLTRSARNH